MKPTAPNFVIHVLGVVVLNRLYSYIAFLVLSIKARYITSHTDIHTALLFTAMFLSHSHTATKERGSWDRTVGLLAGGRPSIPPEPQEVTYSASCEYIHTNLGVKSPRSLRSTRSGSGKDCGLV